MKRALGFVLILALLAAGGALLRPAQAADTTVLVGDSWFCNSSFQDGVCETAIDIGDTVTWDFAPAGLVHSTTHCDQGCDTPPVAPLWDSGLRTDGTFEFTFNSAGMFPYRCSVHPDQMRGIIVVGGAPPAPTPTPPPTPPGCETGDANMDGSVTSIDAALVLQFDAGLLNSLACPMGADVNGDGNVNSLDAALILQFVAGLLDEL
jgi:hypothetical protein